jgi:hypothetical protein
MGGHLRFHSTDFPSEWGLLPETGAARGQSKVSIQLISPASGDSGLGGFDISQPFRFPFN